jgi:hypothetical protein
MDPALQSSALKYIDVGSLASWFQDIRQLPDRQTAVPRAREGGRGQARISPPTKPPDFSEPPNFSLFRFLCGVQTSSEKRRFAFSTTEEYPSEKTAEFC